jgi:hypothetical protein
MMSQLNDSQNSKGFSFKYLIVVLIIGFGIYDFIYEKKEQEQVGLNTQNSLVKEQVSNSPTIVPVEIKNQNKILDIQKAPVLNQPISEVAEVKNKEYVPNKNGVMKPNILGDEILLKFKKDVPLAEVRAIILKSQNIDYGFMGADSDYRQIKLNKLQSVESAISYFLKLPQVEKAQPNFVYKITSMPDDSLATLQWGLKNFGQTVSLSAASRLEQVGFAGWSEAVVDPIPDYAGTANPGTAGNDIRMEEAWSITNDCSKNKDGSPVIVAVLDTGINYQHPELQGNLWDGGSEYPHHGINVVSLYGEGEVTDIKNPLDQHGHGTSMSGIIGAVANNQKGVAGVCGKAQIMAVKVGNRQGTTSSISTGMDFAVDHGAKVLNMSLAIQSATPDSALEEAIQRAQKKGALIVASAGNNNLDNDLPENNVWPCNFSKTHDNVFCVAGVDAKFDLGFFSSYGLKSVQIAAPGLNIVTLADGNAAQPGYTVVTTQSLNSKSNPTADKVGWAEVKPQGEWKFLAKPTSGAFKTFSGSYPTSVSPSTNSYVLGLGVTVTDTGSTSFTGYTPNNESLLFTTGAFANENSDPEDDFKICMNSKFSLGDGDKITLFYQVIGVDNTVSLDKIKLLNNFSGTQTAKYSCYDINPCLNNQCVFGYFLTSTDSVKTGKGAMLYHINLVQKTRDKETTLVPTTDVVSGTSPAAAFVSGVAAMVYAYNGNNFNYLDVKKALIEGGTLMPDLQTKIESGKVLNAFGSLTYIAPPTGVKAVVDSAGN